VCEVLLDGARGALGVARPAGREDLAVLRIEPSRGQARRRIDVQVGVGGVAEGARIS
jgi:hypothetical protein